MEHEFRRFARAAAGEHEDLVEGAERVDRPEHDRDREHRPQHRQGVVDEDAPRSRAVDARRLERLLRQRLQAREQDQEHQRRPLPDVERHEADEGLGRIAEDFDVSCPRAPSNSVVIMPTSLA